MKWEQRALTDPVRITRCWEYGAYNIGIATGPARLVVIDLDLPKGSQDLPPGDWAGFANGIEVFAAVCERAGQPVPEDTYTVRTGRGGLHLYFAAPEGKTLRSSGGSVGWKVDSRAAGGYVVGAGSSVDKRPYEVIRDQPPMPLPEWLSDLLTAKPAPVPLSATALSERMKHADRYVAKAVTGEVEKVQSAREGRRNEVLFKSACSLGRFVAVGTLPELDATDALTAAARAMDPPLAEGDIGRTIRSGFRRAAGEVRAA